MASRSGSTCQFSFPATSKWSMPLAGLWGHAPAGTVTKELRGLQKAATEQCQNRSNAASIFAPHGARIEALWRRPCTASRKTWMQIVPYRCRTRSCSPSTGFRLGPSPKTIATAHYMQTRQWRCKLFKCHETSSGSAAFIRRRFVVPCPGPVLQPSSPTERREKD